MDNIVDDRMFAYYRRRFDDKGRGERVQGRRCVGMEAKFCLTDDHGAAASEVLLQGFFEHLGEKGWSVAKDENLGVATAATREFPSCPAYISTGTGHCKMEFSVPYGRNLRELESHFQAMVDDARSFTDNEDMCLLCLGVHPVTEPHPGLVQRKARHIFWDHAFEKRLVHLFALSADCQVHVDVDIHEVHEAVNAFQGLAGAQIALTASATVWKREVDPEYLDVREVFWDWWLPGEDRAGIARAPFASMRDYVERLASLKPVFVQRNGSSMGIYHYPSFKEYYSSGEGAWGVDTQGEKIPVVPREEDIDLHDTFNWYIARFSRYCTLENRANCQQPPEDIMTIPALTLGIMENLAAANEMIGDFTWEELRASREEAMRVGPQATAGGAPISEICRGMLEVAEEGLAARGYGEEESLSPLWERLEEKRCPAMETRELFQAGGVDALLERYSL
ncbi:MAG: hypothetical protein JW854_01295 [Actinobacteria bacterium]|nr:hypothetical protein [Actinomycetota bacterium]